MPLSILLVDDDDLVVLAAGALDQFGHRGDAELGHRLGVRLLAEGELEAAGGDVVGDRDRDDVGDLALLGDQGRHLPLIMKAGKIFKHALR